VGAEGTYLYCFTRPGAARGVDVPGVDGSAAIAEIELGPVAAVVSRVSLDEFGATKAEENTQNPDWVIPRACRHQQVVRELMARSCVLPVRFGAVFSSEQRLAEIVREKCREIAGFLDSVQGKEEWAVKGIVDPHRAMAWLRAQDPSLSNCGLRIADCGLKPEIRNPKSEMPSPGARYLADRKAHLVVRERLRPWCRAMAEQVQALLDPAAEAARPLKLHAWSGSGQVGQMFFHRAYLLPREGVAAFLGHVERVGGTCSEQGLSLETSGPWPPYTFAPALWGAQA